MIYYTADTHFCYDPVVAGRGFSSAEEMDAALIANWNSVVTDEDTVYFVGDVGFNGGFVPCRILEQLRGHKHLIRGNHDTGFRDARRLYRCFETVTDFWEIEDGEYHVILSHYPILYNKRGYLIHGHLHNSGQFFEILRTLPQVLNAGVDVNGFVPVTLEQLVANNKRFYAAEPPARDYQPRGSRGFLPAMPDFRPLPDREQPWPRHLFLTGRKHVGKSTVLRKLLEGRNQKLGGFLTVRQKGPEGADIYMIAPGGTELTAENLLFSRREGQVVMEPGRFERLSGPLLADFEEKDLILMDELGVAETGSEGFCDAVRCCLDGSAPVYGVIQMGESAFLDEIMARPDVCVVTVNEENRDSLPRILHNAGW